jgi:hypothetical protein
MATLAVTNSFSAGTTIVAADMNQNFDDVEAFVNTTPGVIQKDIVDAKGDLIAATAADAVSRLAAGTNTYVLTADSTEATGLKWAAPTTGDITGLTAGDLVDITAASGPVPTVNVDLSEAATSTSDADGDYFLVTDAAAAQYKLTKANIALSGMNNDSGWTTNVGDITGVTAGTNISGGGTSGAVTVNLAIDAAVDFGSDGSGVDVSFHSATAGDLMFWDASEEKLTITGTDGQTALDVADGNVTITDDLTVTGAVTAGSLVAPLAFNAQTGTTYTFVLADAGKMVTSSNGSAQTVTVPPNSSVAFDVGTQIIVQNIGSANATLAQGAGVTINSKDSNKEIDGQFAAATLIKTATDAWSLIGALA